jgi:superfamily II DNA or RNA helicase
MNLPILDLDTCLLKLGDEILSKILGQDRLRTLSKLTNKSINSIMMIELLKKRLGDQIFSDPILRGNIIFSLKENYKSYLYNGDENKSLSEAELKKLINASWDRRFSYHKRLIEIFNLDEKFLPEIPIEVEKSKQVFSETFVEKNQKNFLQRIIDFFINLFTKFFGKQNKDEKKSILFPYQNRVKEKIIYALSTNKNRMMVHMPTGSGKTRTTLSSVIEFMNNKNRAYVIWLAHTDELCEQAIETMENLWKFQGKGELNIFRVFDQKNMSFDKNKTFIVTTYQKLTAMRTGNETQIDILEDIRRNLSIIIADEAHMLPAKTFNSSIKFLDSIQDTSIIGLTATPGRGVNDLQNKELANFFSKYKISITDENNKDIIDPIKYLQDKNYLANIKAFSIATNFKFELTEEQKQNVLNNFQINDLIIKEMEKDEERNLCIISHLVDLVNRDKSIIVFACSLEHSKMLNEICLLLDINCASIDDKTSYNSRKHYIAEFKKKNLKIIFNYGVLATGFDAPNTNAILIARPTASPVVYNQMLGRGLRGTKVKGNQECWLLDLKDNLRGLPDERNCFTMYNSYYSENTNYNLNV